MSGSGFPATETGSLRETPGVTECDEGVPAGEHVRQADRAAKQEIDWSDSSRRLPLSAFELLRDSSDVWCRLTDGQRGSF